MTGATITLKASDGHELSAYWVGPEGAPRAGVVVVQEIFGVNDHIRSVCDRLADAGYAVVAPAIFDRMEPGTELAYDAGGVAKGKALKDTADWDAALLDITAGAQVLKQEGASRVGVVGFCWGGSLTWLAACRLSEIDCAIAYYGAQIINHVAETPRCPIMLHFGEKDQSIPPEDVARIKMAHASVPVLTYPAGHGFNCDQRADYDQASADLAWARSLDLLQQTIG